MLANSSLPLYLQVSIALVHPLVALVGIAGYDFLTVFSLSSNCTRILIGLFLKIYGPETTYKLCYKFITYNFNSNLLIVAIVPRAAVRVSRSAKLYYSVIAVADMLELVFGTVLWSFLDDGLLLLTGNRFSVRIARRSDATCKLFYLLFELTESLSNYTIVALALERCLIIFFPLRAKRFVRLRFSVMLIALVVAPAWICSFIAVPIIVKLDTNMQQASQSGCECEKDDKHSLTAAFTVALTVLSYMLHTVLNIILVTLISFKLAHIRYQRNAMIRDNLIHLAARKSNNNNKRISNFVSSPNFDRRSGSNADSRIVNPIHSTQNNLSSPLLTAHSRNSNKIELMQLTTTSDSTNAPESCGATSVKRTSSTSKSPHLSRGMRTSQSPYKRITTDINSDALQDDSPRKHTSPKISVTEPNSSHANCSQLSADNSANSEEQQLAAACPSGSRLDAVPERSELSDICSIPEPHPSPRIVRKSLTVEKAVEKEENEEREPESPWVLRSDACRESCKKRPTSSPSPSPSRASRLLQPVADVSLSQNGKSGPSGRLIRHEQSSARDYAETPALRSSSPRRQNSTNRCSRGGGVGGVCAIGSTPTRAPRAVGGSRGGSDGGVGISATVVMVLLASINVAMYFPAAVVELVYILIDSDSLEPSTHDMLSSLDRFLFENLCFAHALNFFVYVGR